MYFQAKNTLNHNLYHTLKHPYIYLISTEQSSLQPLSSYVNLHNLEDFFPPLIMCSFKF